MSDSDILKGQLGWKGETGASAYDIAVLNGYEGTEEEWLNSVLAVTESTSTTIDESSEDSTIPTSKAVYTAINEMKSVILESVFPIGSTYVTQTDTNPSNTLGFGTWERLKKIPIGLDEDDSDFSTIGKTGGEKTHTLTTSEMPNHTHAFTGKAISHTHTFTGTAKTHTHSALRWAYATGTPIVLNADGSRSCVQLSYTSTSKGSSSEIVTTATSVTPAGTNSSTSITPSGTNSSTGSGSAHNNMPPYRVVGYMWLRTA